MAKYRCRFLNDEMRIDDVETIESDSDEIATARASKLFEKSPFARLEVWVEERLVFERDKAA